MQVEGFLKRLNATGVGDIINATSLVTVDKPGLPGFEAFLTGCKPSDIPIKNQVTMEPLSMQQRPCGTKLRDGSV